MIKSYAVILALVIATSVSAFVSKPCPLILNKRSRQVAFAIGATPEPDKYSEAFTSYMTKSHEEKLKAIKVAEDKKNAEIKALKKQLAEMKTGIISTATEIESSEGSVEEISAKLSAYQKFMSEYIVKAQEEKFKAIKAAEEAISKKYDIKLNAFMLNPVDASSITVPSQTDPVSIETYDKRSATVAAAGQAGKSRWSTEEVQRASSSSSQK